MGTAMIEKPASSKRRTIIVLVASIVAVALAVTGLACGLHARNARAAEEAHRTAVAAAQAECDRSIDTLTRARGSLAKQTEADRTQAALKLTDKQVADEKTLTALKNETKDTYSVSSCKTSDLEALENHTKANKKAEKSAAAQSVRLTAAINAVEKSKTAKTEADRKAAEKKKVEEAKKQQEAQKVAAVTQAASSAPVERQSSSSNSSASSHSSTVRRQSSAPRRSYQAPRRSYTPQRRNTYTPRRQYTTPRRTYTPSVPRRSAAPSRPSAPRRSYTPRRSNPAPSRPNAPRNNGSIFDFNGKDKGYDDPNAERVLG